MEVNVINLEGVIIEQIKLPTKTTSQCVSKFKYLYNHAIQGIKVYNPNNYIDYKLYVDNLNDSIFYLVDPKSNITLDYAIFQLTFGLPPCTKGGRKPITSLAKQYVTCGALSGLVPSPPSPGSPDMRCTDYYMVMNNGKGR